MEDGPRTAYYMQMPIYHRFADVETWKALGTRCRNQDRALDMELLNEWHAMSLALEHMLRNKS